MRIVLQRVKEASVTIDGEVHGAINKGYMILVGFNNDDTHEIIDRLVEKVIHLRVFEDENQKMNRSLIDVEGSIQTVVKEEDQALSMQLSLISLHRFMITLMKV